MHDDDFLSLIEAAARLEISPITLRKQAKKGVLRAELVGHSYIVTRNELQRYEQEHKGRPGRKRQGENE